MIALKGDKSLVPQLTQRGGHGAALNAEIVGQLLAVERDGKAGAAAQPRLLRQIGEQLFAGGAL